ncbi:hypothetical protein NOF04DRAFT_1383258 [Fusarium oxysporum II5]|nr:hypothetical protein NOF04DRAFT_1383258 [Fusarium oxysporum II5]
MASMKTETIFGTYASGGTIDANTYRVSREESLRLETEIVKARASSLHESGYLNEDFKVHLRERLKHETYLERGTNTIDGIIERLTYEYFEKTIKRTFDYTQCNPKEPEVWYLGVTGPIKDDGKDFGSEFVIVNSNDVTGIFMKRLDAITEIVKEQLDQAMDIGYAVENVVIGGFGNSPSLIAKLKEFLEGYHRENNCHVKLMTSQEGTTITNAVSEGAGNTVPPQWESNRIPLSHTFDVEATSIICEVEFYNKDAEVVGTVEVDFTKHRNQLEVVQPGYKDRRQKGKKHLRVDWELVIKVVGRDLECKS